jgi:uncharacterized membrane-anchored protein
VSRPAAARVAPSVPHVALAFWVVKLLTTGMGEAISDFLAGRSPLVAVCVGFVAFVVALVVQLRGASYSPVRYWLAVAMVAVFGTMVADAVHVVLGVPYAVTTVGYFLAVLVCLGAWRTVEGSVSIHSITTRRRELFYWATVVATFALGTAAGDLTAFTLRLGYLASVLVFGALILVPLALWRLRVLGPVACFWTAYVLTRPLGASIADWLGKPPTKAGGLGLGDGTVSLVALVVFGALVASLQRTGVDRPRIDEPA